MQSLFGAGPIDTGGRLLCGAGEAGSAGAVHALSMPSMAETLAPSVRRGRRTRPKSKTKPLNGATTIKCSEIPLFALYYAKCLLLLDLF